MNEQDVYIRAEEALTAVIDAMPDDRWDERQPAWFQTGRAGDATLRTFVNYHAYDTAWIPDTLAGRTVDEVGDRHDGDLLGDDPRGAYRRYAGAAIAAVRGLDDPGRTVHLSYGDFPAREYLKHITVFRTFRAHDFARWLDLPTALPDDLVQGVWDEILPEAEMWRSMGVFGPAIPVPDDAPLQERLLGLVGRDPRP